MELQLLESITKANSFFCQICTRSYFCFFHFQAKNTQAHGMWHRIGCIYQMCLSLSHHLLVYLNSLDSPLAYAFRLRVSNRREPMQTRSGTLAAGPKRSNTFSEGGGALGGATLLFAV